MSFELRVCCGLLFATFLGCSSGDPSRLKLVKPTGQVLKGTQPIANAEITLHSSSDKMKGISPRAISDGQGALRFSTYEQHDGVPPGAYRVTVTIPDESAKPASHEQLEEMRLMGKKPDRLGGRFALPETSGLTLSVPEDAQELPPIVLP